MRKMLLILVLVVGIFFAVGGTFSFAQEEKSQGSAQTGGKEDVFAPFKFFVGKWEGTGKGQSEIGRASCRERV